MIIKQMFIKEFLVKQIYKYRKQNMQIVKKKIGRRMFMINAAMQIYKFIKENDDWQFTTEKLKNVITENLSDEKTVTIVIHRYQDDIVLSGKFGCNTMTCCKKIKGDTLAKNWYNEKHKNREEEKFHILNTMYTNLKKLFCIAYKITFH